MSTLFKTEEDARLAIKAREVGASRVLLSATEIKRDSLRYKNEVHPRVSDLITDDFRFIAGQINALNWILNLPQKAQDSISNPQTGDE